MHNDLRVARVHFKTASALRVGPERRACRHGSVGTQRRALPAATDLKCCSASLAAKPLGERGGRVGTGPGLAA